MSKQNKYTTNIDESDVGWTGNLEREAGPGGLLEETDTRETDTRETDTGEPKYKPEIAAKRGPLVSTIESDENRQSGVPEGGYLDDRRAQINPRVGDDFVEKASEGGKFPGTGAAKTKVANLNGELHAEPEALETSSDYFLVSEFGENQIAMSFTVGDHRLDGPPNEELPAHVDYITDRADPFDGDTRVDDVFGELNLARGEEQGVGHR